MCVWGISRSPRTISRLVYRTIRNFWNPGSGSSTEIEPVTSIIESEDTNHYAELNSLKDANSL